MDQIIFSRGLRYLNVILALAFTAGCSSSIYGWQVRTTTTPFDALFALLQFDRVTSGPTRDTWGPDSARTARE
jgi:hypothetical protein